MAVHFLGVFILCFSLFFDRSLPGPTTRLVRGTSGAWSCGLFLTFKFHTHKHTHMRTNTGAKSLFATGAPISVIGRKKAMHEASAHARVAAAAFNAVM